MKQREIPYYQDYITPALLSKLLAESQPVTNIPELREVGKGGGLETQSSLQFLCELYDGVKGQLAATLSQRTQDRQFIDQRTRACSELNRTLGIDLLDPRYETVISHEDGNGRTVLGPKNEHYCTRGYGKPIAPIPKHLSGNHVTLFGPPDNAKLCINAMNAFHRKLKDEPSIISELLETSTDLPKWGADDEDSKTPIRQDLIAAAMNLNACYDQSLSFTDSKNNKTYKIESERLTLPIKRFPGLALPCTFLFYREQPIPLHLYDFALHCFKHWENEAALTFYVPKLENEEDALYIHHMVETTEKLLKNRHSAYKLGSIRLLLVLENPRAIFRVNEIMDALYPYFAGASLGWHDYLASTARLFREDSNYRIPVKADPNIVIKCIKASHDLLTEVVGSRGGIKIGGMYGILSIDDDRLSASFQMTIKGFMRDVITQLKRGLSGFWVAHPDFIRIGLALVRAWELHQQNDSAPLQKMVEGLLVKEHHADMMSFIHGKDIVGLDTHHPLYPRSLIVADMKESPFIANNDSEEIRYNVFQSLQYLTDWLSGRGCVALPATINGVSVRVMDDLATAERSRWEVWHEIHHGRFSIDAFLKIIHEEMLFIRKDLSNAQKIVQVKWDERTEKWYGIAMKIMIKLMTSSHPPEFATELLLPFTVESIRNESDPWNVVTKLDPEKFLCTDYIQRFNEYFSICGSVSFAHPLASDLTVDLVKAETIIKNFTLDDILHAASFHGNIGESKKTLDEVASQEQALVLKAGAETQAELRALGDRYLKKFGFKYLISAEGKSSAEILADLNTRLQSTQELELVQARNALWEISLKRLKKLPFLNLHEKLNQLLLRYQVNGATITVNTSLTTKQNICIGDRQRGKERVGEHTWFELASLSKTMASAFALEYFRKNGISLSTPVNSVFEQSTSSFRLESLDKNSPEWANQVTLANLMKHNALNMHYVNGIPADEPMPRISELLSGNQKYGYPKVGVLHEPGSAFQYSGGGFLVLEHLLESLEQKSIQEMTQDFFKELGLHHLSFEQNTIPGIDYAHGYLDSGEPVKGTRKKFPAFAAGAMGTASDMASFLSKLTESFHSIKGSGPISHDTAIQMLGDQDRLSQKFMGVNIGLGVFIAEAGPNRFAIHQGANDGFRGLFVQCFSGPDRGLGFVILCNADTKGVLFIAEAAQLILKELNFQGVDTTLFKSDFDTSSIPQEEIVNLGYKRLIFEAFKPDQPEAITIKGTPDPLAPFNLAVGSKILEVTNERFARAENLLSPNLPIFDPELYGRQGKIMDSWESVRHNYKPAHDPRDSLTFQLKKPSPIHFVSLSTQFHQGNHPEAVTIEGLDIRSDQWKVILPKLKLEGHSLKQVQLAKDDTTYKTIRVSMYPDGGLSRVGLFNESLPEQDKINFQPLDQAKNILFPDPIPHPVRPLTPKYNATPTTIQQNWDRLPEGAEVDLACLAYGGKITGATNEHYSPAVQMISPYPPVNMFDGSESARSRTKGHFEEVTVELGRPSQIHRIEIDFTFFRNNNPFELSLQGLTLSGGDQWNILVPKTNVKAYAGNKIEFRIHSSQEFKQIKVTVYPDGGINRMHVYGLKS